MSQLPQISDAEWQVMKIMWAKAPCTANQVVDYLSEIMAWQPKTIKTLINRLLKKKALGFKVDQQDKKTYHYYPLISEKECVKAESQSFLQRVFDGSPNILLANFIHEYELSQQDINELKQILEEKTKK
ncbi:BlaI/MecI/CopY family transcriptional regulator [Desulfosporosinus sp. FKA]|uniref:BlaI/MecI/CopY family transcriptional regulator n=1 Tax=Desulfosporosinus sp. FKA TaxID=1969834 RepID=UPI000B49EC48|nr:BlaI/MecI/CopY family transcriptional regulator [Desulfosporosinus sp. FKA]